MEKKIISTNNAPAAIGPYSQAVSANGMIFVSGQLPANPATGELVIGDVKKATAQALENLKAILAECGLSLGNVVKATLFISDMNNFADINEVYATYFTENPPARACVEVARLPKDVEIEIEAIAVR